MFLDLNEHPEKVEGVGQLLFEMCKGVRNMFHSCTGQVASGEQYLESVYKRIKQMRRRGVLGCTGSTHWGEAGLILSS
jgi:hypothetical protein